MRWFRGFSWIAVLLAGWLSSPEARSSDGLRLATFRCDITPPLGQPMFCADAIVVVEQPLLAKGVVIESQGDRYVLCALDWCELCNGSYDLLRAKVAEGAGAAPSHVALQCVHQHTAPLIDFDASALLSRAGVPPGSIHLDPKAFEAIERRLVTAVRQSIGRLESFDRIGTGQAKVDRVASTRRCRDQSGVVFARFSSTAMSPALRQMPEGAIDPYLKTITLARGEKPLVRLHYYATHPQTRYGDGRASSDIVGDAREKLERQEGVFQVYFTGCGGDVTVGKYNDGSDRCRRELGERLFAGMKAASAATKLTPAASVRWRTHPVILPRRTDAGCSAPECLALLRNGRNPPVTRLYTGAVRMAFHQRSGRPIELSSLQIGNAYLLHLAGEPMVDFQLFAQRLRPADFVAVAGYGDGGTGYLCPTKAFAEGGYEPVDSNVKPESENLLNRAIAELLGVPPPAK
ncbi:MAG: hypothetical protein LLG00_03290 [Planctomycetaceae bacterium]|nr:hypothetical protein [Planctomycetaceae bacterium]